MHPTYQVIQTSLSGLFLLLFITLFMSVSSAGFYLQWFCIYLHIMDGNVDQFSLNY